MREREKIARVPNHQIPNLNAGCCVDARAFLRTLTGMMRDGLLDGYVSCRSLFSSRGLPQSHSFELKLLR